MAFTYFFRDRLSLELIGKYVLPALTGQRYINIWDAGCAHGPEPYSLAIILRERMSPFAFRNVRIYATDIDPTGQFGRTITEGVYPAEELQRVPPAILQRYFVPTEHLGRYRVVDELRSRVSFIRHDLLSLEPIREGFSLIVCKNVLLHFNEQQQVAVLRMFHSALRAGGFLVMEQTQQLPDRLEHIFSRVTDQGQVFRKLHEQASRDVRDRDSVRCCRTDPPEQVSERSVAYGNYRC